MQDDEELKSVEGVVVDQDDNLLWDPQAEVKNESYSETVFFNESSSPSFSLGRFIFKVLSIVILLPLLFIFLLFLFLFILIAFFFGRSTHVYQWGSGAMKTQFKNFKDQ